MNLKLNDSVATVILILIFLASACTSDKAVHPAAYKNYVDNLENGLIKTKTVSEIQYTARYLPTLYQALKDYDFQIDNSSDFSNAVREKEGHHYLVFHIQPLGRSTTLQKIYERISESTEQTWAIVKNDFDFHHKTRFKLFIGGEEKSCALYHSFQGIDPSYGNYFMLVFRDSPFLANSPITDDMLLTYDDEYFSGNIIRFVFEKHFLNQLPQLKLSAQI